MLCFLICPATCADELFRVKLPKTFLAVNLSDAFTFEDQDKQASDTDVLEMKMSSNKTPPRGEDEVTTDVTVDDVQS